ncbi:MAG: hypothetical protein LC122_14225 [Chitinophagales bacterium]|nr:hypothetical protein [Chitinophagales bacterium]
MSDISQRDCQEFGIDKVEFDSAVCYIFHDKKYWNVISKTPDNTIKNSYFITESFVEFPVNNAG